MGTKFREIEQPDVPIPVRQLIVGTRLPCDMFIKDNDALKVFFSKDVLYTTISEGILKEKGISELYIYMKDTPNFDFYLGKNRSLKQTRHTDIGTAFKEYAYAKEQYYQIDASLMAPGTPVHFSLFVLNKFNFSPLVEASERSPATLDESILTVAGDVVIKKADLPLYHEYINSLLQSIDKFDKAKGKIKYFAVKETAKMIVRDFLSDPRSGEKIKECEGIVNEMIGCILEDNDTIYTLLSLKGYDYYTYTHSVNVAALSIGLGAAIGLERYDITTLGIGAMLHDVGKSAVSHEILHKQGRLDDTEYNIIKSHVIEGERILRIHKDFPVESFDPVLQHHEKLSGKGYPLGLTGKDITTFGRIAAISDCYDALTTQRPYKPAFTPFHALSLISKETGDYDADLLKTFVKTLGKIK